MKRMAFLALAFLAGLLSPAFAAGTISLSLMQQFGTDNKPLNGGLLYFYAAGTTTPQNAFQDSGLTIPWPNPLTLGSTGRVPQLFFADGQIKVRLTNAAGVVQLAADNLLVVGPSGGGGGGGSVDATTVFQTGDTKLRYGTGVHTGWVRQNGRTIGSATSGATERANADCQPLFEYLWSTDANLVVSTGRGASANADWVANKTIALPDARNRAMAGLGDMGNSDAALFTGSTFASGNGITLGSRLGVGTPRTLLQSALPNATLALSATGSASVLSTTNQVVTGLIGTFASGTGTTINALLNGSANQSQIASTGTASVAGTTGSINGGVTQTSFDTISPFLLLTVYQKL